LSKQSLRKEEIIRSKLLFAKVLKEGKWVVSKRFAIYFLPSSDGSRKVGFTVSRKVKAKPKRNRIKRRLREVYRLNKESLPDSGFMVFMGFPQTEHCKFEDLQRDLERLSKKLKKLQ